MSEDAKPSVSVPVVEPSLRKLLHRSRLGDRESIDMLCARIRPLLRAWAHGRLPEEAKGFKDTEDIVQDVLVRVLANLQMFTYNGDGSFLSYVRKATWNQILDERRRIRCRPRLMELQDTQVDSRPSPLDDSVVREFMDAYEALLETFPAEDQFLVVARLELGMTYPEIARYSSHLTPDAVRMAVNRLVRRLGSSINAPGPEP